MRVWQKIYLAVLAVFLCMLNLGLFLAAVFIYQHNLSMERKQVETECYFFSQNLEHDFAILVKNDRYEDEVIRAVVEGYQTYYKRNHVVVDMIDDGEYQQGIIKQGGQIWIQAAENLGEPFDAYTVIYQKELVEFERLWRGIQHTFAGISLTMSLLLCVLLYLLLKRMMSPLQALNQGVKAIAAGDYEQHISCKGNDEVAELSENVNQLSGVIKQQIGELKRENERKQQLLDNMAHELRTPLTSIYGYAEYLQRARATEEEQYEALSYIMSESSRLEKMGEMLLSMRLSAKEQPYLSKVELEPLFDHIQKMLSEKMDAKGIQLELDIQLGEIYGNEVLLMNLFRNLIENGIRASADGGVIQVFGWSQAGKAVFEIADAGCGMEQEDLKYITEPFYRADKSRSRSEGGVGLGLSIAEQIVEVHDGELFFESQKGKGTRVTIFLQLPNKMIK